MIAWIKSFLSGRSQNVVLDGKQSGACPVLSGVPQGSVLGPCLFLMYINDMPDSIKSNIRLFADDTIMYLTITNHSDCQALQSDLTTLKSWESEWLMAFNPEKCEVIRITKKKKPVLFDYKLHGITLQLTKNAKYQAFIRIFGNSLGSLAKEIHQSNRNGTTQSCPLHFQ